MRHIAAPIAMALSVCCLAAPATAHANTDTRQAAAGSVHKEPEVYCGKEERKLGKSGWTRSTNQPCIARQDDKIWVELGISACGFWDYWFWVPANKDYPCHIVKWDYTVYLNGQVQFSGRGTPGSHPGPKFRLPAEKKESNRGDGTYEVRFSFTQKGPRWTKDSEDLIVDRKAPVVVG
ncbi:hypothetical protein [Streptomyces sp. MST-110588]|uniref:hypothetical protein n=1 Tax=Streptomyces sp. MST-110588 TaxID=2833628 RepID=UPI001F5D57F3|nr:hypothetical protein [Streptomyces sp. MST-110588]UNO41533.1 hypothetical protein KGS77_20645 [Streptomyces sp. MST-110588]